MRVYVRSFRRRLLYRSREHSRSRAGCGAVRMHEWPQRAYIYIDAKSITVVTYTVHCLRARVEPAKNATRPLPACVQLQAYKVR